MIHEVRTGVANTCQDLGASPATASAQASHDSTRGTAGVTPPHLLLVDLDTDLVSAWCNVFAAQIDEGVIEVQQGSLLDVLPEVDAVRRDGHRRARRLLGRPVGRRPSSGGQHGHETCRAWFRYGLWPRATWPGRTTHGRRLHHVASASHHAHLTTRGTASPSWVEECYLNSDSVVLRWRGRDDMIGPEPARADGRADAPNR
jgi:hypothetical protein